MIQRKSAAYLELDQLLPQLTKCEQLSALWDYLTWLPEVEEYVPLGHTAKVMRVESLLAELDDEELSRFVGKHERAMSLPLRAIVDASISDEDQKFPDKVLVASWLMPDRKIRSRALTQFFNGYNVSASNLSTTLENLKNSDLIELLPSVEGREKEFTLTPAGCDRRQRILKKLISNPSP